MAILAGVKKQGDFFQMNRDFAPGRISHGDTSGKRKLSRPFRRHCATHLVLKSENAAGKLNLLTPRNKIGVARIFERQAAKFGVKVHREENVGNHIHAVVSCGTRESFANFLRAVAGLIARLVLGEVEGKFWTQSPFTRLINGARDYKAMMNYLAKNFVEATEGKSARIAIEAVEAAARKNRKNELARLRRRACNSC